jgi:hypothetical protein
MGKKVYQWTTLVRETTRIPIRLQYGGVITIFGSSKRVESILATQVFELGDWILGLSVWS